MGLVQFRLTQVSLYTIIVRHRPTGDHRDQRNTFRRTRKIVAARARTKRQPPSTGKTQWKIRAVSAHSAPMLSDVHPSAEVISNFHPTPPRSMWNGNAANATPTASTTTTPATTTPTTTTFYKSSSGWWSTLQSRS